MLRFAPVTLAAFFLSVCPAMATQQIPNVAVALAQPMHFDSESAAAERCPHDTVVWLNTNTGVYHNLSVRRYGRTHRGGYVCKSEADRAGDREAQGKDR